MIGCGVAAGGDLERYFYRELDAPAHERVERHVARCAECRQALDDLAVIRSVLAAGRVEDAPPGGDWSRFMQRLEARRVDGAGADALVAGGWPRRPLRRGTALLGLLAAAAALVLAALPAIVGPRRDVRAPAADPDPAIAAAPAVQGGARTDAGLLAVTNQHFQRSKVVVLDLATRDAALDRDADWTDERELAAALLDDTLVYRIAAETRGLTSLADVMRDLELVLLEASMARRADREALEHVQSLIRRRDLVTKMNAAYAPAENQYP